MVLFETVEHAQNCTHLTNILKTFSPGLLIGPNDEVMQ